MREQHLCRHPVRCILPPHILRQIAKNGTDAQRDEALRALAIDPTLRLVRATHQLMSGPPKPSVGRVAGVKSRTIYHAHNEQTLPGTVIRREGDAAGKDLAVNEAYDGLGATFDFYWEMLKRNSIDGEGLPLVASVHYGSRYDNAFWNGEQMVFGDGDGSLFNRFTLAVDVIGHELTHGVTGAEANLVYMGQSGALNESLSDVFGTLVKQYGQFKADPKLKPDWLIGAGLFTDKVKSSKGSAALRSMKEPGTAYDDPVLGRDPQPADMKAFVHTSEDNGGVHINSGIANRAFYLAATGIGGHAWQKPALIWYQTVCDRSLRKNASFHEFAQRTVLNAGHLFGQQSPETKAVAAAWKEVGVQTV